MDALVEDRDVLFATVFQHLSNVEAEPATKILDEELLRRAERALDASTPSDLLWRILSTGEALLKKLQQDPKPLTRLLERTVLLIPFDELRTVISADKLEEGLTSPSAPVQILCLAYLRKASDRPSGASFVACSPSLVKTLVTIWLSSTSTEVAEHSLEVIIALLAVDYPESVTVMLTSSGVDEADGQGLLWRRIFNDPEVYSIMFAWTSFNKSNHNLTTKAGQQQITISQARLFDFIARVAPFDWAAITTTKHIAIEKEYTRGEGQTDQPYGGLLKYAANGMIDKNDFLMEVLRQDFFSKLLVVVEETNAKGTTPRLVKAIQEGAGVEQEGTNKGLIQASYPEYYYETDGGGYTRNSGNGDNNGDNGAYSRGYSDGYDAGFAAGYNQGRDESGNQGNRGDDNRGDRNEKRDKNDDDDDNGKSGDDNDGEDGNDGNEGADDDDNGHNSNQNNQDNNEYSSSNYNRRTYNDDDCCCCCVC